MTVEVQTVETLSQVTQTLNDSTRYFAGGTLLMRQVNYGDQSINRLVVSRDPELKRIQVSGDQIEIGAGVTMSDIISHQDLGFLAQVARAVGGPAIRNMATVGGNLFAPCPYGDMATALLALGAILVWADGQQQPIEQLFSHQENQLRSPDVGTNGSEFSATNDLSRGNQNVVASIRLRKPRSGAFRFQKVSRVKPKGVSLLSVAVHLGRESGRVANTRIAFGGMSARPRRALAAEQALQGASLDEAGIERCISMCNDGLEPQNDALASAWYRAQVAPVYLKRLLLQRGEY